MKNSSFVTACRKEPVSHTPIWMMRQAGRTIPAYRALRERYDFLEVVEHAELIAEVTMMPMREMQLDAAVMFADIMLPLSSLGVKFDILESIGPIVREPIRTAEQVRAFAQIPITQAIPQVFDAIKIVRRELDGTAALIGFSGAPFTLASYLIEGKPSRDFTETKRMMFSDPQTWHLLMDRLTELVIEYLAEQAKSGIDAWQLFDSWIGALSARDMREFVHPYSERIFRSRAATVPTISFGTNTGSLLELMASAGPDVVSVDWRLTLDEAWSRIGTCGIQGNLDPAIPLGPTELLRDRAYDVLRRAGGRPGHIFNLGHGVLPSTPLDNLKLLVDLVHGWGQ